MPSRDPVDFAANVTPRRDLSLDFLRGGDVLLMLLVNFQVAAAPAMLRHAEWDGLTLADGVFPIFLVIVGISASLAFDPRRGPPDWRAVVRRAALLFALGVLLGWCLHPEFDLDQLRWTGVLQRIAVVYLACAGVVAFSRGLAVPLILSLAILCLHMVALLLIAAPGAAAPSLAPGAGISGWLDQQLLPGRILRATWDPEGVFSTLPALASGFLGIVLARWAGASDQRARLAPAGVLFVLGGLLAATAVPINKNLWTASFVLVTTGIGALAWAAVRAAWPALKPLRLTGYLISAGQAALTIYVIHMLLIAVLRLRWGGNDRLWDAMLGGLHALGLSPMASSLVFGILSVLLCWMLLVPLRRRGLLLRV